MKKQELINKSDTENKGQMLQGRSIQRGSELGGVNEYMKSVFSKIGAENSAEGFISILASPEFSHLVNASQKVNMINHLQQTHGNRYIRRVIQAKLKIGQPNDKYEQEADRVAELMMRTPSAEATVRKTYRMVQPEITPAYQNISILRKGEAKKESEQSLSSAMKEKMKEKAKSTFAISKKEASFKTTTTFSTDGKFKLDLGPAFNFSIFGLSSGARYNAKDWKGFVELKIGNKLEGLTGELVVDRAGNLTFNLGHKFVLDLLRLSSKLSIGGEKPALTETAKLKNLFGLEGLDVNASLKFGLGDGRFTRAELGAEYRLLEGRKTRPIPTMKIGFGMNYELVPGERGTAMGFIYLSLTESPASGSEQLIQRKPIVGAVDDPFERQADRVAEQLMWMPVPVVQPKLTTSGCPPCKEEPVQLRPLKITPLVQRQPVEEEILQTKETRDRASEVELDIEARISELKGAGQPLPKSVRAFFEPRFGYDFSQVMVHADARAAELARAVKAKAFTMGRNIVFGAGRYSPGTSSGKKLLAHELTHMVQQKVTGNKLQSSPEVGVSEEELEVVRHTQYVTFFTKALEMVENRAIGNSMIYANYVSTAVADFKEYNEEKLKEIEKKITGGEVVAFLVDAISTVLALKARIVAKVASEIGKGVVKFLYKPMRDIFLDEVKKAGKSKTGSLKEAVSSLSKGAQNVAKNVEREMPIHIHKVMDPIIIKLRNDVPLDENEQQILHNLFLNTGEELNEYLEQAEGVPNPTSHDYYAEVLKSMVSKFEYKWIWLLPAREMESVLEIAAREREIHPRALTTKEWARFMGEAYVKEQIAKQAGARPI